MSNERALKAGLSIAFKKKMFRIRTAHKTMPVFEQKIRFNGLFLKKTEIRLLFFVGLLLIQFVQTELNVNQYIITINFETVNEIFLKMY